MGRVNRGQVIFFHLFVGFAGMSLSFHLWVWRRRQG